VAAVSAQTTEREALRARMEARMTQGKPFTYGDLWIGLRADTCDVSRVADQCIQRWRKRDWIAFTRQGGKVIWSLTDAGKEAIANG
jgi:hypothetical protein